MSSRTPASATTELKDRLQRLVSCVSDAVLVVSRDGYRASDTTHLLMFPSGSVPLRGRSSILLAIRHGYRLIRHGNGEWAAATALYYYDLRDADDREIVAYHWHPGVFGTAFSHLHLGPGARIGRTELNAAHLPTGRVGLHDVVRLTIRDFNVSPLRADWAELLAADE